MRKLFLIFILLGALGFGLFAFHGVSKPKGKTLSSSTQKVAEAPTSKNSYIFVPYWTLDRDVENTPYEKLVYFGILATEQGVDVNEPGYKKMPEFVKEARLKESYLTVRMLDSDSNITILNDTNLQKKIIEQSNSIASQNNFKGVILDLELSALPLESLINKITSLNESWAEAAHMKRLTYGTLLYGDTYFRIRPFDVKKIGELSDQVFVMSYDFSKARGSSGPGFPLNGDTYGYNFKTMVTDFKNDVPSEKLVGVIGMFGYDWTVDSQNRSKKPGEAKTTLEFEKYLTLCVSEITCTAENSPSGMKITYKDENGEQHIAWFETSDSARKKVEYLSSQNINSVAYWAYGYN